MPAPCLAIAPVIGPQVATEEVDSGRNNAVPPGIPSVYSEAVHPPVIIMEQLRDVFRRLASAAAAPSDYASLDHEDPEVFLRRCIAEEAMKKEAQKWWAVYKNLSVEWDKFKELLWRQLNSLKRHLLARRLIMKIQEANLIALIITGIKGSIRGHLRSSVTARVQDFVILATQIGHDAKDDQSTLRKGATQVTPPSRSSPARGPDPTGRTEFTPNIPVSYDDDRLPKRRYCPGYHWHRHCASVSQREAGQGNWHRVDAGASDPAAGRSVPPAEQK